MLSLYLHLPFPPSPPPHPLIKKLELNRELRMCSPLSFSNSAFPVHIPIQSESGGGGEGGGGAQNKRKWYAWYLVCVISRQISLHDPDQEDSVLMIDNSHDLSSHDCHALEYCHAGLTSHLSTKNSYFHIGFWANAVYISSIYSIVSLCGVLKKFGFLTTI